MKSDERMFKEIHTNFVLKVRIGNRKFIKARRKGEDMMNTLSSIKSISDVFFVHEINQNLLVLAN